MIASFIARLRGRSGQWPALRKAWLAEHPYCAVCGGSKKLEAHHIVPVHRAAGKAAELDPGNLITLCRTHHFWFGHLGDFSSFNLHIERDAAVWAEKIRTRP
jgi:hypothetical protein